MRSRNHQFWGEVLLCVGLAVGSAFLATISPFDHLGGISVALIVGMLAKAFFWKQTSQAGASLSPLKPGGDWTAGRFRAPQKARS